MNEGLTWAWAWPAWGSGRRDRAPGGPGGGEGGGAVVLMEAAWLVCLGCACWVLGSSNERVPGAPGWGGDDACRRDLRQHTTRGGGDMGKGQGKAPSARAGNGTGTKAHSGQGPCSPDPKKRRREATARTRRRTRALASKVMGQGMFAILLRGRLYPLFHAWLRLSRVPIGHFLAMWCVWPVHDDWAAGQC